MAFDETFIFEFEGEHGVSKFDASLMLELSQPLELLLTNHRVDAIKFRVAVWIHVLLAPRVYMVAKVQSITTECDLFE